MTDSPAISALPCPFCGADARLVEHNQKWRIETDCKDDCLHGSLVAWEFDKRKRALALWNRRSPPALIPVNELEEMETALAAYDLQGLIKALRYQKQCDEDGVMCEVSRQAVDEAIAILSQLPASPPSGPRGAEAAGEEIALLAESADIDGRYMTGEEVAAIIRKHMEKGRE